MSTETSSSPSVKEISHVYELDARTMLQNLGATLGGVLLVGLITLGLVHAPWAPPPAHLGDPDSTIISTKAALATQTTAPALALVGDSSCLINLDVATLKSAGAIDAVNLGTLSYLSLDSFGLLASRFAQGKASPRVVLVVHPDCLRLMEPSERHRALLEASLGREQTARLQTNRTPSYWLGFEDFSARYAERWVPQPLKGKLGGRYGFTFNLQEELLRRSGSMDETATYDPKANHGSAEYRLAPRIQAECARFRAALPAGTRLRVILSPVPRSHALKSHERTAQELRQQIETWLGAEGPSLALPLILPDEEFGTVTHLLPEAARRYSRQVAEVLKDWR